MMAGRWSGPSTPLRGFETGARAPSSTSEVVADAPVEEGVLRPSRNQVTRGWEVRTYSSRRDEHAYAPAGGPLVRRIGPQGPHRLGAGAAPRRPRGPGGRLVGHHRPDPAGAVPAAVEA